MWGLFRTTKGENRVAVTIPTLIILGLALLIPNYLAVRYGILGGAPGTGAAAVAVGGGRSAGRTFRMPGFVLRGYLWKALSPLLFAVSVIMGLAVGGMVGGLIVLLAFLNLLLGFLGWGSYTPKAN